MPRPSHPDAKPLTQTDAISCNRANYVQLVRERLEAIQSGLETQAKTLEDLSTRMSYIEAATVPEEQLKSTSRRMSRSRSASTAFGPPPAGPPPSSIRPPVEPPSTLI